MKKLVLVMLSILLIVNLSGCTVKKDTGDVEEENKNLLAGKKVNEFIAKDLDGKEITNKIFEENAVTVINIWGTFCSPCIEEMPELEKIQKEFKDKKVKVIGIVSDKELEEAKNIIKQMNISYTNIIPDKSLENQIVNSFDYVPVTLFVNDQGEIMEKFVAGGSKYEGFKKIIEALLDKK